MCNSRSLRSSLRLPGLLRNCAAGLLLAAAGSGCVVYPYDPYGGASYYGGAVAVAPPPAQVEYYGAAPAPGYFWIGGYWDWVGGRHVWVRGHWQAPRAGYRWEPHRWEHRTDGWHLRRGHWERR